MDHIQAASSAWVSSVNMTQIASIVIDAMAKTLFWGPLWSFGLYFASACTMFIAASWPAGRAWLESERLLPRSRVIKPSIPQPSTNVIPFRKRREQVAAIKHLGAAK